MEIRSHKKTGLFFGSFNPIHHGHLILASYMAEFTDLDEVWFVVSPQNPLKNKESLLADYHRMALVRVAIEDHPKFKASDIEFKMPKPSYTIDTLTWLSEKYPKKDFIIICGTDIFPSFHKWKNYIHLYQAPLLEISSSFIRNGIKAKKDMTFWMPDKVYQYILEMHFYEK